MESKSTSTSRSSNRELGRKQSSAHLSTLTSSSMEKGFATVLVLILFATFSVLGLEIYLKAQAENRMSKREALSRQAVYISEGGLEWAKSELIKDPLFTGGERTLGEGTVVINVTSGEGGYLVTSDAHTGLARRKIQAFLYRDKDRWIITQYQEIYQ